MVDFSLVSIMKNGTILFISITGIQPLGGCDTDEAIQLQFLLVTIEVVEGYRLYTVNSYLKHHSSFVWPLGDRRTPNQGVIHTVLTCYHHIKLFIIFK